MADLNIAAGLQQMQLVNSFQHDIRDFIDTIRTINFQPADIDVGKIIVGAAFQRRDPNFGWCRVVVKFNPEALDQFFGTLSVQHVGGQVLFVKRV